MTSDELKLLTEEQKAIYDDLLDQKEIASFASSRGGKKIVEALNTDIVGKLEQMARHQEHDMYIRLSAQLDILLTLKKTLDQAGDNTKLIKEAFDASIV